MCTEHLVWLQMQTWAVGIHQVTDGDLIPQILEVREADGKINQKKLELERDSAMEKDGSGKVDRKGHSNLIGWSRKPRVRRECLDKDLKEAKEQSMQIHWESLGREESVWEGYKA